MQALSAAKQMFLRVGEAVGAAEFERLVDVHREAPRHSSPPMPKPSTWLRLRVWPCQVVATCQRVSALWRDPA